MRKHPSTNATDVMQSVLRQLIDCCFIFSLLILGLGRHTDSLNHFSAPSFFFLNFALRLSVCMIRPQLDGNDMPGRALACSHKIKQFSFVFFFVFHFFFHPQAQPYVRGKRFDAAINCVGFTTAPIWSGIFVSFIIGLVLAIGINCIMEIKPPNRFENSRGKQLTFTIQE